MNRPRPEHRPGATGFAALVDRVAVKVGNARRLTKADAAALIDAFADELFATLRKTKRLTWPRRGTFYVKRRKARTISNPITRERMRLPAGIGIGFRAAKAEKERLSDGR